MSPTQFWRCRGLWLPMMLCLGVWPRATLWSQVQAATQSADVARSLSLRAGAWTGSAAEEESSEEGPAPAAPKMDGDDEYGEQRILLRRASWAPWSFEIDAEALYTDNVALASRDEIADTYLRSGFRAGYSNRIVGNLFVNASWDYHTVRHDRAREMDFDLSRHDFGLMWLLPRLNDTFLVARYSYYRLMKTDWGAPLFQDHVASLGLQKVWKISRGQQVFAGLYGDWSTAPQPWAAGRHETSLFTGWKLRLTEALSIQLSYRGAYYHYRTGQRTDWNHVALTSAQYDLRDWLRLSLSSSYAINRSSGPAFQYENFILGAGVAAHWEF